jgi:competence/damage-inducible protein CinA-like protein
MANAEIITIGTEILLGELVDTNAQYIARQLREIGINVFRKTSVGDNIERIAAVIQQAVKRSDLVITTGGLGPTIDDPTREAVARAFGVETIYLPELWEQILNRYSRFGRQPTENNRRQAYIPAGAIPVENPVGTAPAFIYESDQAAVFALPGVPSEMEYLLQQAVIPYVRSRYPHTGILMTRILHTVGAGESQIDDLISDFERQSNPTVGLAAHTGQVDIRITAKADGVAQARSLIGATEQQLMDKIGHWVYGADDQTLEKVTLEAVRNSSQTICVMESGLEGALIARLAGQKAPLIAAQLWVAETSAEEFVSLAANYRSTCGADLCLAVRLTPGAETHEIQIFLLSDRQIHEIRSPYGGPPKLAPVWAVNHSLNLLRKQVVRMDLAHHE